MSNYYFEQIGDTILKFRKSLKCDEKQHDDQHKVLVVQETKEKMIELIKAYNLYAEKKISIENVVPGDLSRYFEYN